jgi:hypothetical protein
MTHKLTIHGQHVRVANKQLLPITASAYLGLLQVFIVPGLNKPLISESYLTRNFKIFIIREDEKTWFIDSEKYEASTITDPTNYIIATASIKDDGLYYIDDLRDLLMATPSPRHTSMTFSKDDSAYETLITTEPNSSNTSTRDENLITNMERHTEQSTHSEQTSRGRYKGRLKSLLHPLNPLEVVHVRLGFPSERKIKYLIKHNVVDGIGTTLKQIRGKSLAPKLANFRGSMRAFPMPRNPTDKPRDELFEKWSIDDQPMPIKSLEGYKGYFAMVENTSKYRHSEGYKSSISELPEQINAMISKLGPRANKNAKPMRFIILDGSKTNLGEELEQWCKREETPNDPTVELLISAPYKHQQNLIEPVVQHEKNALRTNLTYNKSPEFLWFKGIKYTDKCLNLLPQPGMTISKHEHLTGHKPDVSHYVPFYAPGYAHLPKDLREGFKWRAIPVRMVGLAEEIDDRPHIHYKMSYECYQPPNTIYIRHDVVWEHTSPHPSLLSQEAKDRFHESFDGDKELKYAFSEMMQRHHPESKTEEVEIIHNNNNNDNDTPSDATNHEYYPRSIVNDPAFTDIPSHEKDFDIPEATKQRAKRVPIARSTRSHQKDYSFDNANLMQEIRDRDGCTNTYNKLDHMLQLRRELIHKFIHHPTHEERDTADTRMNETSSSSSSSQGYLFHAPNNTLIYNNEDATEEETETPMSDYNRNFRQQLYNMIAENQAYTSLSDDTHNKTDYYIHPLRRPNNQEHIYDIEETYTPTEDAVNCNRRTGILKGYQTEIELNTYNPEPPIQDDKRELPFSVHLPTSLEEALTLPDAELWLEAYNKEINGILIRETWTPMDIESQLHKDATTNKLKTLKSKVDFKIKLNADRSLKYKCRLVACGYSQIQGKDYDETFAPTAKYKSFMTIMNLTASMGWKLTSIDVQNAYLESDLDKPLYMKLPTSIYCHPNGDPVYVTLHKSLYGLKQAGALWHNHLDSKIDLMGFKPLMHDQCVFTKTEKDGTHTIIMKYVDDIVITGNSPDAIQKTIKQFEESFRKITYDENMEKYIAIDIRYNKNTQTIYMSQRPYIEKILKRFNLDKEEITTKPTEIPINPKLDYRTPGENENDQIRDLVGSLRFLADRTLPNLLSSVSLIARGAHNPSNNHLEGGKQILKYLNNHQDDYMKVGGDPHINLFGYTDASYVPGADSKSQLGYCFYLNLTSGAIVARSKKDTTISHSSTEAEIKAIDLAIREATWLRGFLSELGFPQQGPTIIWTDNASADLLARTNNISDMTSHMVMRINYIYQEQKMGNIKLQWIDTDSNVSDVLTKPLPIALFQRHSEKLLRGHNGRPVLPAEHTKRTRQKQTKIAKNKIAVGKATAKISRSQSAMKEPISTLFKGAPEVMAELSTTKMKKSSNSAHSREEPLQSIGEKRPLITKTHRAIVARK